MVSYIKPRYFFYIMLLYVFASYFWWTFLLLQKNDLLFRCQTNVARLEYNFSRGLTTDNPEFLKSEEYRVMKEKFGRQRKMIVGEGLVFIILLILGALQLIKTFDKEVMLAAQQKNFLLSVTHELKTPISSIKLTLQTLAQRMAIEEKFRKLINNALDDISRLQAMIDNMLYAARMDSSNFTLYFERYNLSDLLLNFIQKIKTIPGGNRIETGIWDEDADALVDKDALYSVMANLVENALKYSPEEKKVLISLKRHENQIVIEVADEGPGIPNHEKQRVFEKFYRIGNEDTRSHKGTGLGLYIARKIIKLHGGHITISDNTPSGTVFRISLPRAS